VALGVLVALVTVTGVLHATGAGVSLGIATSMQVHVGAALLSIPLALWHVWARRIRPRRTDLSRRNLLRAGALAGGGAVVYFAVEGVVRLARLPGGRRRFTGSHERGSGRPQDMPITQWLDDSVQSIDPSSWRLALRRTDGAVREWTLDELEGREDRHKIRATLDCTGGWFAEQEWEGVTLERLLGDVGWASSIVVRSQTGYARRFPARDAPHLLLATRVAGGALDAGHGAPARLVAPGRRGFWWVKWVVSVEASSTPWWWQPPFPLT
jgi:DMSO/TMAO reductase YedYZ molybdopterin-dependent catalytic subunit